MLLIIGLGNPGEQFKNTRHNIGRETAEAFRKKAGFSESRSDKKWNAEISEGKIGKGKIAILRPNTFMNKSGQSVAPAARFFKVKPKDIFIIHDDADLTLGKTKLSFGRSSAGHKGVESIIRALKTKDFWRFRIGIAGQRDLPAEKLVLRKWSKDEERPVKKIIKKTAEAIKTTLLEGPEKAMNDYNK